MKMSPESKISKKKYPLIKDYKRKLIKATFTLGVVLSPFTITSCMGAQRPPMHQKTQVQKLKTAERSNNLKSNNNTESIKKPIKVKGDK